MGCKCPSSYIPLAYAWAILSIVAAVSCPFGIYFSNWVEIEKLSNGKATWDSFSSFRLCRNESSRFSTSCASYLTFGDMFSHWWQAVTLLLGAGACFLVLVALTAIFGFFVTKLFNKVVVILTMVFQILGVILFVAAILLFPVGMNSSEVKVLCGAGAGIYNFGDCKMGWAYILVVVGTAVGTVAALLSWSTWKWREKNDEIRSYHV